MKLLSIWFIYNVIRYLNSVINFIKLFLNQNHDYVEI